MLTNRDRVEIHLHSVASKEGIISLLEATIEGLKPVTAKKFTINLKIIEK